MDALRCGSGDSGEAGESVGELLRICACDGVGVGGQVLAALSAPRYASANWPEMLRQRTNNFNNKMLELAFGV